MEIEAAKQIGAGLATLGMIGAGIGVGNIFGNFLSAAVRNPSAAASQIGNLFVGAALAEALGILAFVLGILLKFG
ncbi:F0F1 ATP synthase subunit C [Phenylobacterium kunshanense]|jgi:F-type H+-transporting ATPase subunit c|uniref:ATP synthase subunit c n=1 Tax=Phenylobacterium kunshanense TaxID=1445034 RepID=A0A328B6C9_9CAUL|nr:F0F1 ATP synthase subunit C [Phenylobacterium kunshanense]RAK62165.1 F0F1 ATP synthase subunit C [Phenylobacterium kunshanense]